MTNYRSRQQVLDAAYAVIRHASGVRVLPLRAAQGPGMPGSVIRMEQQRDGRAEADWIARQIGELVARGRRPAEIAVLVRTRHMTRAIEAALREARVPYTVRGTTGFWDRRVVRDVLAYLRAIANPLDSLSLARIVNLPARGLGDVAWERFVANAVQHGLAPARRWRIRAARMASSRRRPPRCARLERTCKTGAGLPRAASRRPASSPTCCAIAATSAG